jgi:hypothetical protein
MPAAAMGRSAGPNATQLMAEGAFDELAGSAFFRQGYSLNVDRGTRMYWRTTKLTEP